AASYGLRPGLPDNCAPHCGPTSRRARRGWSHDVVKSGGARLRTLVRSIRPALRDEGGAQLDLSDCVVSRKDAGLTGKHHPLAFDFCGAFHKKLVELRTVIASITLAIEAKANTAARAQMFAQIVEKEFPFLHSPKFLSLVAVKANHESCDEIE